MHVGARDHLLIPGMNMTPNRLREQARRLVDIAELPSNAPYEDFLLDLAEQLLACAAELEANGRGGVPTSEAE